MGQDNSIVTYVKKEKIVDCLNWLYEHSWAGDEQLALVIDNKAIGLRGTGFKINDHRSDYLRKDELLKDFDIVYFNTSLIFDIDPELIESLGTSWMKFNRGNEYLEDFKESFLQMYLGDGKMRYGGFDSRIFRLKEPGVFVIELSAVTTDMSIAMEKSLAVKKWMLEFSRSSEAILTHLDQDYKGRRLLYYMGEEIDVTICDRSRDDPYGLPGNFLEDYLKLALTYDRNK